MRSATVTETKNQLSSLLQEVQRGQTVLIVSRNRPVARLEPVASPGGDQPEARIGRLEHDGVVQWAQGGPLQRVLTEPPPTPERSALAAILEEREAGR